MDDPNGVRVGVTCDCGEQFQIPVGGLDLETLQFTCPGCGDVNGFTPEQVAGIVESHKLVREKAIRAIRDASRR